MIIAERVKLGLLFNHCHMALILVVYIAVLFIITLIIYSVGAGVPMQVLANM